MWIHSQVRPFLTFSAITTSTKKRGICFFEHELLELLECFIARRMRWIYAKSQLVVVGVRVDVVAGKEGIYVLLGVEEFAGGRDLDAADYATLNKPIERRLGYLKKLKGFVNWNEHGLGFKGFEGFKKFATMTGEGEIKEIREI